MRITVTSGAGPGRPRARRGPPTLAGRRRRSRPGRRPRRRSSSRWPHDEHSPLAGVKTTSLAESVIALPGARERGADEALFLNSRGNLCEATTANVFVVRERVETPAAVGRVPGRDHARARAGALCGARRGATTPTLDALRRRGGDVPDLVDPARYSRWSRSTAGPGWRAPTRPGHRLAGAYSRRMVAARAQGRWGGRRRRRRERERSRAAPRAARASRRRRGAAPPSCRPPRRPRSSRAGRRRTRTRRARRRSARRRAGRSPAAACAGPTSPEITTPSKSSGERVAVVAAAPPRVRDQAGLRRRRARARSASIIGSSGCIPANRRSTRPSWSSRTPRSGANSGENSPRSARPPRAGAAAPAPRAGRGTAAHLVAVEALRVAEGAERSPRRWSSGRRRSRPAGRVSAPVLGSLAAIS